MGSEVKLKPLARTLKKTPVHVAQQAKIRCDSRPSTMAAGQISLSFQTDTLKKTRRLVVERSSSKSTGRRLPIERAKVDRREMERLRRYELANA
jgi:hypothetical protein